MPQTTLLFAKTIQPATDCGYAEAVAGADCTHECELCKGDALAQGKNETPALLAATPRAAGDVTTADYDFVVSTGLLTIKTNAGTTAWRTDTGIGNTNNVKSLVIAQGVTSIGDNAFLNCGKITGVLTIPASVTSIGDSAFYLCSGLTGSLTIPEGVTSIGNTAFTGCIGFTGSLTIPDSVTRIGNTAFRNCTNLASVTFAGNTPPTTFGTDVFDGTAATLKIYVPAGAGAAYKAVGNLAALADKIVEPALPPIDGGSTGGSGGSSFETYYYIKATAGSGGSINTAERVRARVGESAGFTIIPNKGYQIADVRVNGKSIGAKNYYAFTNIQSDQTIYATFKTSGHTNPQTGVDLGDVQTNDGFYDVGIGRYSERLVYGSKRKNL